jgi:hypothetical protein
MKQLDVRGVATLLAFIVLATTGVAHSWAKVSAVGLQLTVRPSPVHGLANLPERARLLVGHVRETSIPHYRLRICKDDPLTYQRIVEGALPSRLSASSPHVFVQSECTDSGISIGPYWRYVHVDGD